MTEANLIESYTIQFSYENGTVGTQIYSEADSMNSGAPTPIVLLDAKKGARKLLDNVCGFLWNTSRGGGLKDYPLPCKFVVLTLH